MVKVLIQGQETDSEGVSTTATVQSMSATFGCNDKLKPLGIAISGFS